MEELDLKWEVSAGCYFSWIILATIALKGDGTNIRATRTRAAFKLRLLPGSMMSATPLEAGARVWGVKNRSLKGGFSILVRNGIASWRVGASLLSWSCFFFCCVYIYTMAMAVSHLARSSAKACASYGLGCIGEVLEGQPEHQTVFNLLILNWKWEQKSMYVLFKNGRSVPYRALVNPTGF